MKGESDLRKRWNWLGFVMTLCVLLACRGTPVPSPTPDPWAHLSPEVHSYLEAVYFYSSEDVILSVRGWEAVRLRAALIYLEGIKPPPEMEAAHKELVEGYRFLYEGRKFLDTAVGGEAVSEGIFMIDWGIRGLREHQRMVFEYVEGERLRHQGP